MEWKEEGTLIQSDANAFARELMERTRLGKSEAGESWHGMDARMAGGKVVEPCRCCDGHVCRNNGHINQTKPQFVSCLARGLPSCRSRGSSNSPPLRRKAFVVRRWIFLQLPHRSSLHSKQFDVEHQRRIGWNHRWESTWAIAVIWRARQRRTFADAHLFATMPGATLNVSTRLHEPGDRAALRFVHTALHAPASHLRPNLRCTWRGQFAVHLACTFYVRMLHVPRMTCPTPMRKRNFSPRSREESNFCPFASVPVDASAARFDVAARRVRVVSSSPRGA